MTRSEKQVANTETRTEGKEENLTRIPTLATDIRRLSVKGRQGNE